MPKIIKGESIRDRVYANGSHGNFSLAHGRAVLAAAAIGDTVELLEFEVGIKVFGVRVSSESGLGTSVKATVKMGDHVIAQSVDVAAGTAKTFSIVPYAITGNEKLTVIIEGAEATGDINVIPEYIAEGY